jgi:hypothetical protein
VAGRAGANSTGKLTRPAGHCYIGHRTVVLSTKRGARGAPEGKDSASKEALRSTEEHPEVHRGLRRRAGLSAQHPRDRRPRGHLLDVRGRLQPARARARGPYPPRQGSLAWAGAGGRPARPASRPAARGAHPGGGPHRRRVADRGHRGPE